MDEKEIVFDHTINGDVSLACGLDEESDKRTDDFLENVPLGIFGKKSKIIEYIYKSDLLEVEKLIVMGTLAVHNASCSR